MDSCIFTILQLSDSYMGGAHGMYSSTYYNFDVETGHLLSLSDILDDSINGFEQFIEDKIRNSVRDQYDCEIDAVESDYSSFYMRPDGIVLVFPMYALGGGTWEKHIFIPYEALSPYLKSFVYYR